MSKIDRHETFNIRKILTGTTFFAGSFFESFVNFGVDTFCFGVIFFQLVFAPILNLFFYTLCHDGFLNNEFRQYSKVRPKCISINKKGVES